MPPGERSGALAGASAAGVSEAGASVYSASEFASRELPELDVSLRGAVSIARRLQDPLAELVKIDPKSIGVGQYQHDVNQTRLARSLDAVVEDLRPLLDSQGVELRRPGALPVVKGDAIRIRQVFQNLISNAAKYNDKPVKWVEVGCDNNRVPPLFYVRDNGIGIAQHHQDTVFQIFKRLHEQNKYGGGAGAGLTITRKIIERHGGRIWLESVPGEGTSFYFTLSGGA